MGLKDRYDTVTEQKIGAADDASCDTGFSILTTGALGRNTAYELGFPYDPELFGAVGPIHRRAFDKHGLPYVVFTGIFEQFLEKIAVARSVPQMMMWVDDWEVRFECCF